MHNITHTHHAHTVKLTAMIFFSIFFLLLANAVSATPQAISVQGKLTDTLNNPYTGSKNFAFRIYSAQSGGSALYTEFWNTSSQQVSLAYGGYFSVLLGSQTALALPFDQQYWLEITVEGETLSPRYKLGSTPYTYHANITDNLAANANASGTLNMNSQSITNAAWLNATNLNVSTNAYFGGNVGIGTSNPLSLLGIYQSGSNTIFNATNGTVNTGLFLGTLLGGQAGASIGTNSNHQFRLFSNGTDRLTVDTNGNVGIGTTGPGAVLDVNGIAKATSFRLRNHLDLDSNAYMDYGGYGDLNHKFSYNGTETRAYWDYYNKLSIRDSSAGFASRFNIDSSGNVGIGTTSPGAILHVAQNNGEIRLTRADVTGGIRLLEDSTGNFVHLQKRNDAGSWITMISGTEKQANSDIYLVQGGGNVGVGTTTVGYLLDVAGAAHASSFPTSSDIRFKANITELDDVLPKLENIRAVTFDWNDGYKKLGRATNGTQIGVIAQEVERQFPELVTRFNAGGNVTDARSVDYGRLSAVLLEGIKEQQVEIEQLKAENELLKSRVAALERGLSAKSQFW